MPTTTSKNGVSGSSCRLLCLKRFAEDSTAGAKRSRLMYPNDAQFSVLPQPIAPPDGTVSIWPADTHAIKLLLMDALYGIAGLVSIVLDYLPFFAGTRAGSIEHPHTVS